METKSNPRAGKSSWGKRIAITVAGLLILLVLLYFVGTSSAFIKAMVLPKVGNALNAKVTADDISLSPFSQVHIRKLRVETTGPEPLLTAEEARVRYSLMDIIGGNIKVDELTLDSPVITIVEEADGSSNLDPILKKEEKPEQEKPKSDEPTKLSLKNVALKNGIVRQVQKTKDGGINRTELQGVNVSLDQIGNGQSGKLNLAAAFALEQKSGVTNNVLGGDLSGGYDIRLSQDLLPDTIKGSTKLRISRASGSYADLNGFNASLDADLTPKEIREVALKFARADQQLGQLRLSGPLDIEKKEGVLKIELLSLDKNALALAGAGLGYDFRNSLINSSNQVTISQNGSFFAANGKLTGNRISVAKEQLTTPEMDLGVDYQVAVNTKDKTALLEKLNIAGASGGKEFIRATLDQQMNLSWGEAVKGYKDAAFRLVVTNFNLAEWKAVIGTNVQSGVVGANVSVVSQKDGKQLNSEIAANISDLSAQFGSNRVEKATVQFEGAGTVENLNVINVPRYTLALRQGGGDVLQGTGAARYQLDKKETTAQLTADGSLNRLLMLAAMPDASASAGTLKVSANYTDVDGKRKANGMVGLDGFTGKYGAYQFTNFQTGFEYNVEMNQQQVEIHRAAANFAQGFNKGGTIDLKGRYNLEKKSGQITFKAVGVNEHAFAPVLAPSLGENRLVSISLDASGEAALDPEAESAVKTDVKLANWVVQDKEGKLPKAPLGLDLKVDAGKRKDVLEVRQLAMQLTPTARAKNLLQLQGKLDLAKTNATASTLSLKSESFDVTPYYNLFAGGTNGGRRPPLQDSPAAQAPPGTISSQPPPPAQSGPEKEPEPMTLPFQQFAADLKIDRFYLRDIAISNWTGNVSIRSNMVQLKPFNLELNGGAVSLAGNFDVGRPGYVYDVAFKANDVPLAPIANSLELAGSNQLAGTFIADAQLRGAGITGPNLRKNLGGKFDLTMTNVNYLPGGPKLRRILVPISMVLRVPELTGSPINWVDARTHITNGTVQVAHATVESEAFLANVTGTMTLADVLTNSPLNLPLDLSLRRSLAEKAKILPLSTPADAKYAKIGNVYTIRGTWGDPKPEENKAVLAGLLLQSAGGLGLGNEKVEGALGAVGNILTGQKGSNTNSAGTNASPVGNIVQGIGSLLGGKKATNNPPATQGKQTNAPPAQPQQKPNPIGDLLRALPGNKTP
jgi:hypothetical protein